MNRSKLIDILAEGIHQIMTSHPLRVAIDGVDAAGKTTLADELAQRLASKDRCIIRASLDDFHHPASIRYVQGELSPEGFYQDSYNYSQLIDKLLFPLGPGGNRKYLTAVFHLKKDQPVTMPEKTAPEDAILIMDGIFMLRPELIPYWDLTIYLDVHFDNSMARGIARDSNYLGSWEEAMAKYHSRYVPGQMLYHREANPLDKADILIDNNKLDDPGILRMPMHFYNHPS
jgi:uridine kinase